MNNRLHYLLFSILVLFIGCSSPKEELNEEREVKLNEPNGAVVQYFTNSSSYSGYKEASLRGFRVIVANNVFNRSKTETYLTYLDNELSEVWTKLSGHTGKAQWLTDNVPIWVEWNARNHAAWYHNSGSRQWLIDKGINTAKVGAIEITNVKLMYDWGRQNQPLMILHELSHGYHDKYIGYNTANRGSYIRDYHAYYGPRRYSNSYANTNQSEYFAELTEAYFGNNDQAPVNRNGMHSNERYLINWLWGL
jgi:hypothetical protein